MTVNVKTVIERCKTILQDGDSVRWPVSELAKWIGDAAREIALQQPSATSTTVVLPMVVGTRQTIDPELYQSVIRVIRNVTGAGNTPALSVTPTTREMLDTQFSDWHDATRVTQRLLVRHVVIDIFDPTTFYVFPGNTGDGKVECLMSAIPATPTVTGGADPEDVASYAAMTVPIIATLQSALLDYVLYRAFSKDAQVEGASARAQAHWSLFSAALQARMGANMTANANMTAQQPFAGKSQ